MEDGRAAVKPLFQSVVEPRLLTRQQAAQRCGLTESGFSTWVGRKLVPGPLPGTRRWDAKALDQALDRLSGLDPEREMTPYEKWKQPNAAREAPSSASSGPARSRP